MLPSLYKDDDLYLVDRILIYAILLSIYLILIFCVISRLVDYSWFHISENLYMIFFFGFVSQLFFYCFFLVCLYVYRAIKKVDSAVLDKTILLLFALGIMIFMFFINAFELYGP